MPSSVKVWKRITGSWQNDTKYTNKVFSIAYSGRGELEQWSNPVTKHYGRATRTSKPEGQSGELMTAWSGTCQSSFHVRVDQLPLHDRSITEMSRGNSSIGWSYSVLSIWITELIGCPTVNTTWAENSNNNELILPTKSAVHERYNSRG
jgi:transcription elongation factor